MLPKVCGAVRQKDHRRAHLALPARGNQSIPGALIPCFWVLPPPMNSLHIRGVATVVLWALFTHAAPTIILALLRHSKLETLLSLALKFILPRFGRATCQARSRHRGARALPAQSPRKRWFAEAPPDVPHSKSSGFLQRNCYAFGGTS